MRVVVRLHGRLADLVGSSRAALDVADGCTLREAFEKVSAGRFRPWQAAAPEGGTREPVLTFLNSRMEPEDTTLKDGDVIDLVVPSIGG